MKELAAFIVVAFLFSWAAFGVVDAAKLDLTAMVILTVVVAMTAGVLMGFYSAAYDDAQRFHVTLPFGYSVSGILVLVAAFVNIGIWLNLTANAWSINFLLGILVLVAVFVANVLLLTVPSDKIGEWLEQRSFQPHARSQFVHRVVKHAGEN